jgi:hypothetical protein
MFLDVDIVLDPAVILRESCHVLSLFIVFFTLLRTLFNV